MFIVTYGFGDSVTTVPVYGFLSNGSAIPEPAVVDIEFMTNLKRTMNFVGNLS